MKYFAMIDGERRGPLLLDQLETAGVTPDTYVWCRGMSDWAKAKEVAEICRYFRIDLHNRMHPLPTYKEPLKEPSRDLEVPVSWRYLVERSGEEAYMEPEKATDCSTPPRTWIAEAIVAILLCCPLTGAVALYWGIRSRSLWQAGKKEAAHTAARTARIWVLASLVAGCFIYAFMLKFTDIA